MVLWHPPLSSNSNKPKNNKKGGHAVDTAIAMSIILAVVCPHMAAI